MIGKKFIHYFISVLKTLNFTGSISNYDYLHKIGIVNSPFCFFANKPHKQSITFLLNVLMEKKLGWPLEVVKLQTSFDKYFILFGKYENNSIHRLGNLVI